MSRRSRKDYRALAAPERLSPPSTGTLVRFPQPDGQAPQVFDFALFKGFDQVRSAMQEAFYSVHVAHAPITREGAFYRLQDLFNFLADTGRPASTSVYDLDDEAIADFLHWINNHAGWRIGTRHTAWIATKRLLRWMQIHRPTSVHPNLHLPFNPFPNKNRQAQRREGLSKEELARVLVACREDIQASWRNFEFGRQAIAAAPAKNVPLEKLDLSDRAVAISAFYERFGSRVPSPTTLALRGKGLWRFNHVLRRSGGLQQFCRYFHPTAETIVPYIIAVGAQLFANPDALRLLKRDAVSDHLFLEGRSVVSWDKGRAAGMQRRTFVRDKEMSPPVLIERVLAMTEPLLVRCQPQHQNLLFLYEAANRERPVQPMAMYLFPTMLKKFVERHAILDDDSKPLALKLSALRTTGLNIAHAALNNDILRTQILANHASPETTRIYVDSPAARAARELEIGRLQAKFVDVVQARNAEAPQEEVDLDKTDGRAASASGFICANPLDSPMPGQRKGSLCSAWLGCFTCPNAVIPLAPETLARLLKTKEALVQARRTVAPDRWELLYAPKLTILERDVLPRFPTMVHEAAAELLPDLLPLPDIE